MKQWLKFFGLAFFSDKIAAEARRHGYRNLLFAFLLAFAFFLTGYMCADVVPFAFHYGNSAEFRRFTESAFSETGIELTVEDGCVRAQERVNTFTNAADADKYSSGGYGLIVDTRPANTPIVYSRFAVSSGGDKISYEEYLTLSDLQKKEYTVETVYTDEELVGGGQTENAPVLRDYYYNEYVLKVKSDYLYIFGDFIYGSFETDAGVRVSFGGLCANAKDGKVSDAGEFIKDVYYGSVSYTFTSYFLNAMMQLPLAAMIVVFAAVVTMAVGKALKCGDLSSFGVSVKTVGSFVWFSALLTGVVAFALGFWAGSARAYALMLPVFAAIIFIRSATALAPAVRKRKKELINKGNEEEDK